MSSTAKPLRVGVVGAGVAGCALARKLTDAGAQVTIFEMGRGAGGRMATRKTRDMPGLAINHGAPLFVASHDSFRDLIAPLVASGSVREWEGKVVDIDAKALRVEPRNLQAQAFVSSPDMTSMCEALIEGADARFGTQVARIGKDGGDWVLYDKDQGELGRFDWTVWTSHTVGHQRWQDVFGYQPPLWGMAEKEPALKSIIEPLAQVESEPVMVAMVAFEAEKAPEIMALDFDVAHVAGNPTLARVVRHVSPARASGGGSETAGKFVSLCFHSSPEFARKHAMVYGSTSAAAKLAADKWKTDDNKKKEQEVLAELMHEASAVLGRLGCNLSPPVFGPILHRWGSAFTSSAEAPRVDVVHGFAVCGDFAGQRSVSVFTGVETAALSGLQVANAILSARARI